MKTLVICHGEPWEALASTTLIKSLQREDERLRLTWVSRPDTSCLFKYNSNIDELHENTILHDKFDRAINLTPTEAAGRILSEVEASEKLGYSYSSDGIQPLNEGAAEVMPILRGEETKRNYFQVMFRIADMTWKGEGYDFSYYPRNKMKKRKTGVAISDDSLREFIKTNLELNQSELWHVPMREDLLKRIDEINRVRQLITDDLFTAHAGIAMRKDVEFLDTQGLNMSIEFFGKGSHYRISHALRSLQMQPKQS